jgi:outer membrane protein
MGLRRRAALFAAVFGSGTLALAAAASAETLADAIALAYETNPTLLTQRSILRNADEAYFRTRASLGPTISADLTASGSTDNDLIDGGGGASGGNLSAGLNVNQTIYSGGRLRATMEAQRASLLSARESLRRVEQQVLQQVVSAYTGVRRAEQQLAIAEEQVAVLERQENESQVRFEVGANTITDVAQSQARLAGARTSLISAQNTLNNARTQYLTVVGQMPEDLQPEPALDGYLPDSQGQAFDVAAEFNPQLRSTYLSERQQAAGVSQARAARRPTVSVRAGVSAAQSNSSFGGGGFGDPTAGLTSSITASVPIYAGRTTESSIRSAEESLRQANISIDAQIRSLNQSVQEAWNALVAAGAQIESQREAVRATELAAEGTREEQQAGLRTTLDVLNAEQELRQAEQSLVNAEFNRYISAVALLVAMGVLEPEMFGATVAEYDPQVHFDAINGFDLPWVPLIERIDAIGAAPIPERIPAPGETVPVFEAP